MIMSVPGKRQIIPFILWASLLLFALSPVHSAGSTLTLAWDPNTEDDLAGYKIYHGTHSGDYDSVIDVGNITQYTVTGLEPATLYYLALTAYDTSGNESDFSDEVSGIPTNPTNIPPTANAGPDQTVNEGVTVTLDASNSSDPDDGIASYQWEQTNGIPVTLSDPTAVQPTFTAPDVGPGGPSLTFQLTVTDNGGLQDTDTCIVNVTLGNIPPTADAGPDLVVDEGVTVTLDASNSSDPDDGIASYLWEQTNGIPVTLSDPTAVQPTFTAPDVGPGGPSLTFQLTVTDNGGLQDTDTCIVNVTLGNIPPTADAGPDLVVDEGVTVTLDASNSSDPDDGIASYLWEQTTGIPVTLSDPKITNPTFVTPSFSDDDMVLSFQVTVMDYAGLQASDKALIIVETDSEGGYSEWGCFIATAAYGSYLNPHVKILRDFRDKLLISNSLGRKFVDLYYQYGHRLANHIGKYGFLKSLTRQALLPLIGISSLSLKATASLKIILLSLCLLFIFTIALRSSQRWII